MNEDNEKSYIVEKKEGKDMAVSMAIIPTLKGEAAVSIKKTLKTSKITSYSPESKIETERKIQELLQKRDKDVSRRKTF